MMSLSRSYSLVVEEEIRFKIFSYFSDIINQETKIIDYRKFWSIIELFLGLECLRSIPNGKDTFGFLIEIPSHSGVFFYIEKSEEEPTNEIGSLKARVINFYNNKNFGHKLDTVSYRQTVIQPKLVTSGFFLSKERFKLAFVKTEDFVVNDQFAFC